MTPDCRLCNRRFTAALSLWPRPQEQARKRWCEKPSCFRYAALSLGLAASLDRQTDRQIPQREKKSVDMKAGRLGSGADGIMGKKMIDLKKINKQSHKEHYCYNYNFFTTLQPNQKQLVPNLSCLKVKKQQTRQPKKSCCCHSVCARSLLKLL